MQEIGDTTSVKAPQLEPQQPGQDGGQKNTARNIVIGAVVLLVIAAIAAAIYGLATHPVATSIVRDIAIITLALVTIVIGLFLAILIFQLQSLIALLRDEIEPILRSTNQTISTVRGTTTFVSDAMVKPMIQTASLTAGVLGSLRSLAGTGRQRRHRNRSRPDEQ